MGSINLNVLLLKMGNEVVIPFNCHWCISIRIGCGKKSCFFSFNDYDLILDVTFSPKWMKHSGCNLGGDNALAVDWNCSLARFPILAIFFISISIQTSLCIHFLPCLHFTYFKQEWSCHLLVCPCRTPPNPPPSCLNQKNWLHLFWLRKLLLNLDRGRLN